MGFRMKMIRSCLSSVWALAVTHLTYIFRWRSCKAPAEMSLGAKHDIEQRTMIANSSDHAPFSFRCLTEVLLSFSKATFPQDRLWENNQYFNTKNDCFNTTYHKKNMGRWKFIAMDLNFTNPKINFVCLSIEMITICVRATWRGSFGGDDRSKIRHDAWSYEGRTQIVVHRCMPNCHDSRVLTRKRPWQFAAPVGPRVPPCHCKPQNNLRHHRQ